MVGRVIRTSALMATALAVLVCPAVAVAGQHPARQKVDGNYIVILQPGLDPTAIARRNRVKADLVYTSAIDGFAARLTPAEVRRLRRDPAVVSITPDEVITAEPPRRHRRGDGPVQAVDAAIRRIGADRSPTAHIDGRDRGIGADIAIIDSGIDKRHPDLRVVGGVNCSASPGSSDETGHGTWVAGAAGARDNRIGVVGSAPGVRLWSVRVLDATNGADLSNVLCGVDWVTAHADTIEVATMAIDDVGADDGNCGYTNGDLLHQAVCRSVASGVTYVVPAGNFAEDAAGDIPNSYDEAITVSTLADSDGKPGGHGPITCELDPDDSLAYFSNFGADIDLTAPGECVWTTALGRRYEYATSNGIAVGFTAGAAADYLVRHPGATPAAVHDALVGSGEPIILPQDPDGLHEPVLNMRGL